MSRQHQIAFKDQRELLYHLDELVRTMPPGDDLLVPTLENLDWIGRARSLVSAWEPERSAEFVSTTDGIYVRSVSAHAGCQA